MIPCSYLLRIVSALAICIALTGGIVADTPEFGKISDEEWALGPPEQYPEASAMILFDEGIWELEWNKVFLNRHVRIKVFNKDGVHETANIEIPVYDGDDIRDLEAHTVLPDGRKIEVEDFYDKTVNKVNVRAFTFPGIEDGCILEYAFRLKRSEYGPRRWEFQNDVYTERSTYVAKRTGGTEAVTNNIPMFTEPVIDSSGDYTIYTLELTDLMPIRDEPLMGAKKDHTIWVHHRWAGTTGRRSLYGWDDLGSWVDEYIGSDVHGSRDEIQETSDSLCEGLTEDIEKIRRIYTYVSDNIVTDDNRDDADDIKDIMRDGRGTTYDKNLLCVKLLEAQDVPAQPMFICTRSQSASINARARSLTQFNRLICCVDYDTLTYLLDPAADCATFPYPDQDDLVDQGFLIDDEDSRIFNIDHRDRTNGTDLFSIMHIDEDGAGLCSLTVIAKGYAMDRWCREDFDSLTLKEMIADKLDDMDVEYDIAQISSDVDSEKDRMIIEIILRLTDFAAVMDSNLLVPVCVFPVEENPFESESRMFPVDFRYTFTDKHQIQIYVPEGMEIGELPRTIYHRIDGGIYRRKVVADANQIYLKAEMSISRPVFPLPLYASLKELYDIMSESSYDNAVAVWPEPESEVHPQAPEGGK